MKKRKSEPAPTKLDPSHPNHDAILLKRSRLEAHRRRRAENANGAAVEKKSAGSATKKAAKKPARKRKT